MTKKTKEKTKYSKEDKSLDKLMDLTFDKLDNMMTSIEDSKIWKQSRQYTDFTFVMHLVMRECLTRMSDRECMHFVKDRVESILKDIVEDKLEDAKQMKKEISLK
tara:strand:+ start:1283 stop:1597 length:315 start_codon:yes stop_codon:yes gene_type:complete